MMFEEAKFEDGDTEQLTYKDFCKGGKNGTSQDLGHACHPYVFTPPTALEPQEFVKMMMR